jgi:uncharacterized protein YaaW (UPF0174 family)
MASGQYKGFQKNAIPPEGTTPDDKSLPVTPSKPSNRGKGNVKTKRSKQLNVYGKDNVPKTVDIIVKRCLKMIGRDVTSIANNIANHENKWRPLKEDESRKLVSYVRAMMAMVVAAEKDKKTLKKDLSKMTNDQLKDYINSLLGEKEDADELP